MYGVPLISRKFLAFALICALALMSAMSSVCPACDRMEQPSSQRSGLRGTPDDPVDTCDKDGCSCCGFQLVAANPPGILTQGESVSVLKMVAVLPPAEPTFDFNYPPRL